MLGQLLMQMDAYLSEQPFKRRAWFRAWKAHILIQPALTKNYPLWQRNADELRLLRLFNLTPEELDRKIQRYWKKPFWRRWFASFGMKQKIDVLNYYRHCLSYQVVRADTLQQQKLLTANASIPLLDALAKGLHQFNLKFANYLEKRCRDPKWIEKHYLVALKNYQQQLQKTFSKQLTKCLQQIKITEVRTTLRQQAEQEYQQVEALMLHYHHQWLINFLSRPYRPPVVPEKVNEVTPAENSVHTEQALVISDYSQPVAAFSQSSLPRTEEQWSGLGSLHGAKEWIKIQRQSLKLLIKQGSLEKVEELLGTSLNEIKTLTEFYLGCCEKMLDNIQAEQEVYKNFLKYLENLQGRLKPLWQGGILLFHPDHMMHLNPSQAMQELITRYSQAYLGQSRAYLDRFESYYLRVQRFFLNLDKNAPIPRSLRDCFALKRRIEKLKQSQKELADAIKKFQAQLKETEAQLKETEAQRAQDKEQFAAQLKETEAQRAQDKEQFGAHLKQTDAKLEHMTTLFNRFIAQQPVSAPDDEVSNTQTLENNNSARFFKPS